MIENLKSFINVKDDGNNKFTNNEIKMGITKINFSMTSLKTKIDEQIKEHNLNFLPDTLQSLNIPPASSDNNEIYSEICNSTTQITNFLDSYNTNMAHLYIIEKILEVNELNSEMEKKIEEYEITTAYDIFLHSKDKISHLEQENEEIGKIPIYKQLKIDMESIETKISLFLIETFNSFIYLRRVVLSTNQIKYYDQNIQNIHKFSLTMFNQNSQLLNMLEPVFLKIQTGFLKQLENIINPVFVNATDKDNNTAYEYSYLILNDISEESEIFALNSIVRYFVLIDKLLNVISSKLHQVPKIREFIYKYWVMFIVNTLIYTHLSNSIRINSYEQLCEFKNKILHELQYLSSKINTRESTIMDTTGVIIFLESLQERKDELDFKYSVLEMRNELMRNNYMICVAGIKGRREAREGAEELNNYYDESIFPLTPITETASRLGVMLNKWITKLSNTTDDRLQMKYKEYLSQLIGVYLLIRRVKITVNTARRILQHNDSLYLAHKLLTSTKSPTMMEKYGKSVWNNHFEEVCKKVEESAHKIHSLHELHNPYYYTHASTCLFALISYLTTELTIYEEHMNYERYFTSTGHLLDIIFTHFSQQLTSGNDLNIPACEAISRLMKMLLDSPRYFNVRDNPMFYADLHFRERVHPLSANSVISIYSNQWKRFKALSCVLDANLRELIAMAETVFVGVLLFPDLVTLIRAIFKDNYKRKDAIKEIHDVYIANNYLCQYYVYIHTHSQTTLHKPSKL